MRTLLSTPKALAAHLPVSSSPIIAIPVYSSFSMLAQSSRKRPLSLRLDPSLKSRTKRAKG